MKKVLSALLAVVALTMLAASCSTSGSDDDGDTYSVSFKLEGKEYKFTKGLSKNETGTALSGEACAYFSAKELTINGLTSAFDPTTGYEPAGDYISLQLDPFTAPGTYVVYDVDLTIGDSDYDEADKADFTHDFQVVVTAYGDVGGVVEGTFSGKVTNYDTGIDSTISEGVFKVIREPDDSINNN